MTIRFDDRVAIVTGAGQGLGRSHALALAERGAKVVVNDLGAATDGTGGSSEAAKAVVTQIESQGGEALANGANVAKPDEVEAMVAAAKERWGRVDILVNNAGILRDKSFAKMTMEDYRTVLDVHLMGSVHCSQAVWPIMREQNYGRIVVTTSSAGLYGNFGQANYGAAKMGVVGLMNVLHQEGAKYGIRVNTLSPSAGTRMTEGLVPQKVYDLLTPESISHGLLVLVSEDAPSKEILAAGGGTFSLVRIYETGGIVLGPDEISAEAVAERWAEVSDPAAQRELGGAFDQTEKFVTSAAEALGLDVS
ncbi:MAG: SDR family NAD(P)-dependent oxidoreductase [Alphaproteobacteria bacterium]|jgi:NAD(P)-dependent dehydrogenase (short-subunit alcohol dehydrogenase family)|nr:SDR family NAD(P)-dependent oxidoreductase [Alphaproteobacteria bacterium]HJP20932.1 SDR family NAD(P)-dependent oxidoreductase [Alphaproteobacteria bacterium]